jgi:Cof subfamily protein (haloacid dehalogenase superfamily)
VTAKPKLLAVDLDGTLLDARGAPHDRDLRAIRAAIDAGVVVSILTGRLYSGTRPTAEVLGMRGPVGCADGSHVVRAHDHETLVHHAIRGRDAHAVREGLLSHGAAVFLFARDIILHDDLGEPFLPYVRTWSDDVRHAKSLATHHLWDHEDGITAVVAIGTQAQIEATYAQLSTSLGDAAQLAVFAIRRVPGMYGLVGRAKGGTKGSALLWIAEHHGIAPYETICVGDWLNDVPMMQAAGRSYAMGQAPDEVRRAATHVLEETHETGGGVARAIEIELGIRV